MARGDSIGTSVPSVGAAETQGTTDLLTILTALVTVAESKVTPSEIDMDATLDFNSQAGENVKYLEFVSQGGDPATTETAYTKGGEFYFQDSSSNVVQITAAGQLNVSATGSVTGAGYGSGGVAVNWNAAGTNYQMLQGASTYAAVTCSEVQLYDSTYTIGINPPTLSASYDITLPAELPAASRPVQINASGVVEFAGTRTIPIGIAGFEIVAGTPAWDSDHGISFSGTTDQVVIPIDGLTTNDTLVTVRLRYYSNVSSGTPTIQLCKGSDATVVTDSFSGMTHDSTNRTVTLTCSNVTSIANTDRVYIMAMQNGTSGGMYIRGMSIDVA